MNRLVSLDEANALIDTGKYVHLAGDENLLKQLHRGTWIGGTIPYFLTRTGGVVEREKLFVTEFPDSVKEASTCLLDIGHILSVAGDAPRNGFSLIVVPGMSDIHTAYGLTANNLPGIFETPIIGWTAGVHLDDLERITPKVFDGATGEFSDNRIAVMRVALHPSKTAKIGIINPFQPGSGDEIVFPESGFTAKACIVNGQADDFYDYVQRTGIDQKLPLITNRSNHRINVSFQQLDHDKRIVKFYAPVLRGQVYRHAEPMPDYRAALIKATDGLDLAPVFSCNCILNYVYGRLEGSQHIPVAGPATFGEVAHILLNQTLVYLTIADR